ncbi:MAG: cyclic nucleotide-binding domain-containing protein [Actinomycetota bacterium]
MALGSPAVAFALNGFSFVAGGRRGHAGGDLHRTCDEELFGLHAAVAIAGVILPGLALLGSAKLRGMDRRAEEVRSHLADKVGFLGRIGIFSGASGQALESLAAAIAEQQVAPGEVVLREGEAAEDFFVIGHGTLWVTSTGEVATEPVEVTKLTDGDYFGEIGLLERIPRTATVRASSQCSLYRIRGEDFLSAGSQTPGTGMLLGNVAARLARTHPSRRPTTRS